MKTNPSQNLKMSEDSLLRSITKFQDPASKRLGRVLTLALRKRFKLLVGMPLLISYCYCQDKYPFKHFQDENMRPLQTKLSDEDIRYNREFQRMRFLDEPHFEGYLENSRTRQMLVDGGVSDQIGKSRKDLHKKSPHYRYF